MKNILKNILVGGMTLAVVLSCDMDMRPTTAIVFDEETPIIQSQSDIDGLYAGVLASYRAVQYGAFTQSSEVMCDGFNALVGFGNNYGSIHRTDASFTTSDSYVETMWASHYSAIKNYNIAIEQAETVTDEALQPYADLLMGTAMFCRAYSYLTLARHFGPVYDEETAEDDLCVPLVIVYDQYAKPARATMQDVYDQIGWDLDDAYDLLEDVEYQGMASYPFVSLDAINALRARYYLDIQDYDNAADYAKDIIDSKIYALSTSSQQMDAEYLYDAGLDMELDVGHVKLAGGDPVRWLERLNGRVPTIHAKPGGGNSVGGVGDANDWPAIFSAASASGAKWAVVECETRRDTYEDVESTISFLRKISMD